MDILRSVTTMIKWLKWPREWKKGKECARGIKKKIELYDT